MGLKKIINAKVNITNKNNFRIKAKVKRETEIPEDNVLLHIPAKHCCVYNEDYLI